MLVSLLVNYTSKIFMDSLRLDYHIQFFSLQETPYKTKEQSSQGHKKKIRSTLGEEDFFECVYLPLLIELVLFIR